MRILQIRFKNLNSLVGEWQIDLTHPRFVSDGIFAIVGPTGAGKTTLLDALCLALYGRTPRLNAVTKSSNEILSRRTGDCFAEVTFATQAGRFRCHWSQHRARQKPDGELQQPKHELVDADTGQILDTKIQGVAEKVEAITGMDFDRFTRSMLLAQGEFAAFLQAAPRDRAEILEQITGTRIYSQISMRVHERWVEEGKRRDLLIAELAGLPLLSAEEEAQRRTRLAQTILQEGECTRQIAQYRLAMVWLNGMAGLKQALQEMEAEHQAWQVRQEVFAPARARLQRAIRALELAGDHAGLTALRHAQERDHRDHDHGLTEQPTHAAAVQRATASLQQANALREQQKEAQKAAAPLLQQVRTLDLQWREREAPLQAADQAVAERERALGTLRLQQNAADKALAQTTKSLDELTQKRTETQADEALVAHLTAILSRFEAVKTVHAQHHSHREAVNAARNQVTQATRIWQKNSAHQAARQQDFATIQGEYAQAQTTIQAILGEGDLTDWHHRLSALQARKTGLHQISAAVQLQAESRQQWSEWSHRQESLQAEQTALAAALQGQRTRQTALEQERERLERELALLHKIQAFEEARHHLQDGEPCPLCGAEVHPFAIGNLPIPDATAHALETIRAELQTASEAIAHIRVKQGEVTKDREHLTLRQQECSDRITATETQITQGCQTLSLEASRPRLAAALSPLQAENEAELDRVTAAVQAAEKLEKTVGSLRKSLENNRELLAVSERTVQESAQKKALDEQSLERVSAEARGLEARLQQVLGEAQQAVSGYGIQTVSVDLLDRVGAELTARRSQWLARQQESQRLEQQITTLTMQKAHRQEQIQASETELLRQKILRGNLQRERDALRQERHQLFGDRHPDQEAHRLAMAVEAAEKGVEVAQQTFLAASQALDRLNDRLATLEQALRDRSEPLHRAEETFLVRLPGLGFADEADYLAASLPEEERTILLQQAERLTNEQTEWTARKRDREMQLASEQEKRVTDQSRGELDEAMTLLVAEQNHLQQEMGAIRQTLTANDRLQERLKEQTNALEAQRREFIRWDGLRELIGSADGKKYRNFAQGLTFEVMIGHANRQLMKLSDRYLLIRDPLQPLDLNVMDNYQAGEIRSTKNLSGGESFIVSLSLALGLSHMASRQVRVDSLFLDEGFGTLDEESLETALETLSGLHQEGKLIGIISHIPALKERIQAQIQVIPQAGGTSILSGPGCGRSGIKAEKG